MQEKPKIFNQGSDNQAPVVTEQIDRAPIIVSPSSQSDQSASNKGKEICKTGRSVIVRAGTVSVSIFWFLKFF